MSEPSATMIEELKCHIGGRAGFFTKTNALMIGIVADVTEDAVIFTYDRPEIANNNPTGNMKTIKVIMPLSSILWIEYLLEDHDKSEDWKKP